MDMEPESKRERGPVLSGKPDDVSVIRRKLSLFGDDLAIDGLVETTPLLQPEEPMFIDDAFDDSDSKKLYIETYIGQTKKGYNPSAMRKKQNQDSLIIITHHDTNSILFGVFDGHGIEGEKVSSYLASRIPSVLFMHELFESDIEESIRQTIEQLSMEVEAGTRAFVRLRAGPIDTQYSGSTLVCCVIRGEKAYIGNVGDSRMISVRSPDESGELSIESITVDHKPDIPSEKDRIIASGGRVESIRYDDGLGPARVWFPSLRIPGLAMSRSIGDKMAHSIGVSDTPDIFTMTLSKDLRYLIIGSDGLFEFTSYEQMGVILNEKSSIMEAVEEMFTTSSALWLQREGVIDDTTIIIIKMAPPKD